MTDVDKNPVAAADLTSITYRDGRPSTEGHTDHISY